MENWKAVKGYDGLYEVSDLGNVKGLYRKMKHPTKAGFVTIKETVLKPHLDKGGYVNVNLWVSGKQKRHRVHQLVAVAFLDHEVDGFKAVVNHKDFNRQNNRKDNLEITSQRNNADQKHLPSASDLTGVKRGGNKWIAAIYSGGRQIYLGSYLTEAEAGEAYQLALKEIQK